MGNNLFESEVFSRKETTGDEISPSMYNFAMGAVLLWGFGINWLIVQSVPAEAVARVDIRLFMLAYFASCLLGVYLFTSSAKPLVSFLGYNFVVVPFGFVVNLVVGRYSPTVVLDAVYITAMVTGAMMLAGTAFPDFFKKISTALTISLLIVIVVELVETFIFHVELGITDWIVALIFCGYIGYDWGRANQIPKTLDNAVDSAASLYMDIINLFLRILRILGRRK